MGRVLAEHNDVLRSCKWECCGYTAEVEGDSMVLLFHEAADAAAFCLQVRGARGSCGMASEGVAGQSAFLALRHAGKMRCRSRGWGTG